MAVYLRISDACTNPFFHHLPLSSALVESVTPLSFGIGNCFSSLPPVAYAFLSNNELTFDQQKEGQPQQPATEKKSEKTINKRLQRTQAQVNEVVDIMRVNIEKVLERDKNLSQLDDRAAIDKNNILFGEDLIFTQACYDLRRNQWLRWDINMNRTFEHFQK
ncbi:hypothetical protein ACTXT7_004499 [Hymenolepis weldensis]